MKTEKSSSRAAGRTLARSQVRKQEEYEANRAKGNETNVSLIWMLSEFTPSLQRRAADRKADCVSSVLELTRRCSSIFAEPRVKRFFLPDTLHWDAYHRCEEYPLSPWMLSVSAPRPIPARFGRR